MTNPTRPGLFYGLQIAAEITPFDKEDLIIERAVRMEKKMPVDLLEKLVPLFATATNHQEDLTANEGTVQAAQNVALHVLNGFWRETQTTEDALLDLIGAVLSIDQGI